ncbi:MBL fold metallo-hydrolase [bacterium]|nr:MBL fold metallo-hydrolase [bacterium]
MRRKGRKPKARSGKTLSVLFFLLAASFLIYTYCREHKELISSIYKPAPANAYAMPASSKVNFDSQEAEKPLLSIRSLDVGQGDCAFVTLPDNKFILVDGGDQEAGPKVRAYLEENGLTNIFCLIATHPHADHIGGLCEILKGVNVERVYMPGEKSGATGDTKAYRNLLKALKKKGLSIKNAYAGTLLHSNDLYVCSFLAPEEHVYEKLNDTSACLLIVYGNHKALLPGDAEKTSELEMTEKYSDELQDLTFLKVAHHGSRTSSTETFLRIAKPEVAFISLGKDNDYKHPHKETMNRLERWCGAIYRTDEEGSLEFVSDGENYEVKTN